MKKIYSTLLALLSLIFVGVGMTACEQGFDDSATGEPSLTVGAPSVKINSVTVEVSATNIKQYAYVVKGAGTTAPKPVIIFKDGTVVDAPEGNSTIALDDLEYGVSYKLFIAAKISGGYYDEVLEVEFATENVTEDVTIIRYNYDGADIHIRFPEEVKKRGHKLKWMVSSVPDNKKWKPAPVGYRTDAQLVQQNDKAFPAFLIHGDTTLRIREENRIQFIGQDTIEYYNRIAPGEPFIVSIQEVIYTDESIYGDGAGWYDSPFLSDDFFAAYSSSGADGGATPWSSDYTTRATVSEEDFWPEDSWHKTLHLFAKDADPLNATVDVSLTGYNNVADDLNAKGGYLNLKPQDGVYAYCVGIIDHSLYTTLILKWGVPKNRMQWFMTSYFAANEGFARTYYSNAGPVKEDIFEWFGGSVIPGGHYHVLVTAMAGTDTKYGMEPDPTRQSFVHLEFDLPEYTLPAPEIVVTPLESNDPFLVNFNVKCTNYDVSPVEYASFACNYTRDFKSALEDSTYAQLIAMNTAYGIYLSANDIRLMNSPNGFTFTATSREDAATGLVVVGWNSEARPNNPDAEGSQAYAESRSAILPDAERIESSLFEELKGEWTATASLHAVRKEYVREENGDYVKNEDGSYKMNEIHVDTVAVSKVVIGDVTYPEALSEDIYTTWTKAGVSREKTDEYFTEFKSRADLFNRKVRGQNRLLCSGLDFDHLETSYKTITDFASPMDLFSSDSYSCWTIEEIFYDFGPKWYLQVNSDGKIVVPVYVPTEQRVRGLNPMSNWKGAETHLVGYDKPNNSAMIAPQADTEDTSTWPNLPVEISEDKNTITIKPLIYTIEDTENVFTFNPSILINTKTSWYGVIPMSGQIVSDIVLTRGWTEPEQPNKPAVPAMLRRGNHSYTPDLTMTSVKTLGGAKVANTQTKLYERTDLSKIGNNVK